MGHLISSARTAFARLLYKRTILVLTILCCVAISGALWNMSRLSSNLIESQALQNATLYAQSLKESRTLYSSEVVSRAQQVGGIIPTHDYVMKEGGIPLPATFLIELGERIRENNPGISVRLYSNYPFPSREAEGGPRDDFEKEAINYLEKNSDRPFFRIENFQGRPSFRYAQADIMKPSCVGCHNSHPESPKTDWKVGEMRGVLEITQPLDNITEETRAGLRETFFMLAGMSVLAIVGLTLVLGKLRQNSRELERRVIQRTAQLAAEREKSERLLLNILPEPIAQQLKEGQNAIADRFAEVTILFADVVGFTKLSERVSPEELVNLLDKLFSEFDLLSDRYGLEKIKTIGDAYMVACGLPNIRPDHAEAVAQMALEMQHGIARFNIENNCQLSIRIGINSGPVVAGVIGKKKFIYDLWGDAVNTASRMESHGVAGQIQVTESTFNLLKDKYVFEERGAIEIKGKGEMNTYLLLGRNNLD